MTISSAILLSNDEQTISVCTECIAENGKMLVIKNDFASLILELQENDYAVILCDCSNSFSECAQWVKIIKKMRPKVPLLVISNKIDKSTGGKLYQEGIFNLCEKPINKNYLKEILSTTWAPHNSRNDFNKLKNIE